MIFEVPLIKKGAPLSVPLASPANFHSVALPILETSLVRGKAESESFALGLNLLQMSVYTFRYSNPRIGNERHQFRSLLIRGLGLLFGNDTCRKPRAGN